MLVDRKAKRAREVFIHEFGHAVVGRDAGLPGIIIVMGDDSNQSPRLHGNTKFDNLRDVNQRLHPAALRIAVAGTVADMLTKDAAVSNESIAASFTSDASNVGDMKVATEALGGRKPTVEDVMDAIAEARKVISKYLPDVVAHASDLAERFAKQKWAGTYQVPANIDAIVGTV